MPTSMQDAAIAPPAGFEQDVVSGLRRYALRHHDLTLTSVFQPVFSLAHMRAVGYEGLLRAHDAFDCPVPPLDVFGDAARRGELLHVDRLALTLHLENFKMLGAEREWLFLNVHAGALTDSYHAAAFAASLSRLDLPPRRIVLEMQEARIHDLDRIADEVRIFREQGFLIALDDFGAGDSNLERIWQLDPDIVKIDRMMLSHAAHRTQAAAILPGFVSLLHEAGKLVLIEGVETEHEAQLAFACDADFVQGFHFGRPGPGPADSGYAAARIGELAEHHRSESEARERRNAARLAPYIRALMRAGERLAAGEPLEEVCWNFLALDHAARCFLLDAQGRQAGRNIVLRADRPGNEARFMPVADAQGANWVRRPYFRAAMEAPERVQVTKPYLSINEALPCVTLSLAIRVGEQLRVLCGDIDWIEA
ncbi:EAL domain-containing protein (putative c-di-GMP-specific phosphodiesterase class I) [Trinickia symbiotica]|uniref:EAL domain-containing protein n=1 Tax=Trinickia symbiotica TaxID=863227 RepID=A0A2N7X897_9BURK|nr:EAL domain-containing protein [Trinickia symbiotica]PMS37782.1 EAL domain-containing protein [Trinickia symbiotica]PPK44333.1 EAL domain-containing protein (putative c-di-GMP-specific phosphodiesterase class I) [Trinickia symbiotica]